MTRHRLYTSERLVVFINMKTPIDLHQGLYRIITDYSDYSLQIFL